MNKMAHLSNTQRIPRWHKSTGIVAPFALKRRTSSKTRCLRPLDNSRENSSATNFSNFADVPGVLIAQVVRLWLDIAKKTYLMNGSKLEGWQALNFLKKIKKIKNPHSLKLLSA